MTVMDEWDCLQLINRIATTNTAHIFTDLEKQQIMTALDQYFKLRERNRIIRMEYKELSNQHHELLKLKKSIPLKKDIFNEIIRLKAEIEELKNHDLTHVQQINKMDIERSNLIQESNQAIEIVKRLEEESKPENVFDIVNDELMPMVKRFQNQIEITNWVIDLLQSILKGDTSS